MAEQAFINAALRILMNSILGKTIHVDISAMCCTGLTEVQRQRIGIKNLGI